MYYYRYLIFSMFLTLSTHAAHSENADLGKLLEQINSKTDHYEQFKGLLTGADHSKRLAAFEVLINQPDETLRQLALNTGLYSSDQVLRGRSLSEILLEKSNYIVEIDVSNAQNTEKLQRFLSDYGTQFTYTKTFRNDADNCVGLVRTKSCDTLAISISGTTVNIGVKASGFDDLSITLELDSDGILKGKFSHEELDQTVPAQMKVF